MKWPFKKSKSKKPSKNGRADEELEAEAETEEEERRERQDRAEKNILKTLRKADDDRKATKEAEETHVADIRKRRKATDTASRKAQEKASEILGEEAHA